MACFATGNAAPSAAGSVLFTIPDPSEFTVTLVADTASVIYVGNSSSVSSSNGFLVGTVPVAFDCKANKGTTLYAVGNGTAKVHWIFGA